MTIADNVVAVTYTVGGTISGLTSRVSAIDLTNTAMTQVAQGNPVTDVDGARQVALLFPAGTPCQTSCRL